MNRFQITFAALVLVQALHSIEEYIGNLWESFPPAEFLTGLVSHDHRLGFLIINVLLAAFGCWCVFWPVRRGWPSAGLFTVVWITIGIINGIGHPLWTLQQGEYTPGVITAPILLVLALMLAGQLRKNPSSSGT
jgi:Protein of unknown function with HXXEE motif